MPSEFTGKGLRGTPAWQEPEIWGRSLILHIRALRFSDNRPIAAAAYDGSHFGSAQNLGRSALRTFSGRDWASTQACTYISDVCSM